jgi:hypothetical protein
LFLALDARLKNFSIGASMNDDASIATPKYWRREWRRLGYLCCRCHRGEAASILTVGVPETLGFDALYAAVKDRGYLIYACKLRRWRRTTLKSRSWRIADDELHEFLEILQSLMTAVPARYLPMLA